MAGQELPNLSSLSALERSGECVFSLVITNDGRVVPRVDVQWEVLPRECAGLCERELSILAAAAMAASSLRDPLDFVVSSGTASALVPTPSAIAGLVFNAFTFEDPSVHASMHGRWRAHSVVARQCQHRVCTIGYIATFKRDLAQDAVR
jgi:hypothetical protein